jgi:hypothetical protein
VAAYATNIVHPSNIKTIKNPIKRVKNLASLLSMNKHGHEEV